MKTVRVIVFLASLTLPFAVGGEAASENVKDSAHCKDLGFTAVSCSTCDRIKDIVADEGLTKECLQCCHEAKRSVKKYASARLVYDPWLLNSDAELRGFVKDRAADHPALTLEPTPYARTALFMSEEGADPSEADTVSIRRWKVDSIAGYLYEHL